MSTEVAKKKINKPLRWNVFIPAFGLMLVAVVVGVVNNEWLAKAAKSFFGFSLENFGWLYQLVCLSVAVLVGIITFSKVGKIRLGGKDAKPRFKFWTWFAMSLTGGIAVGIVNWGINEPLVYFGNVYGELDSLGIQAGTMEAARFALGRSFYNWSFIPYATYAICGLLTAYLYFNRRKALTVTATLSPLFGPKVEGKGWSGIIDTLSALAICMGMASGLGTGMNLVLTGLKISYGIETSIYLWIGLGVFTLLIFTSSSYLGLEKGIKRLASFNSWIFYGLLLLLIIAGPTFNILRLGTAGLAEWLHNFFLWGLDPIDIGGPALTQWWTLFDWAMWIAYAPIMGLFLARIAYGRTIREFLVINWILPSVFGIVWFTVWGGTGLTWQMNGVADMVGIIKEQGAVAGVWLFLQNLPFGIGKILVPIVIITLVLSFSTAADGMTSTVSALCVKGNSVNEEAPGYLKIAWGVLIGSISVIMGAFAGGVRGIEGVRQLAAVGGFLVLFVFILQIASFVKVFFIQKPTEEVVQLEGEVPTQTAVLAETSAE